MITAVDPQSTPNISKAILNPVRLKNPAGRKGMGLIVSDNTIIFASFPM